MEYPLHIAGRMVAVPAELEPLLRNALVYSHAIQERERYEVNYTSEMRALYAVVKDKLVFPRGLLFRVREDLKKYDHVLVIKADERPFDRKKFIPDFAALGEVNWRWKQFAAFEMIARYDDGIIDAVTAFGKSFIVSQICKGYNKANILVVVPGIGLSGDMFNILTKTLGKGKVGRFGGTSRKDRKIRRVIVTTPESAHHISDDFPDIVLYDEVHTSASEDRAGKIMAFNSAKLFGFTATVDGRSDTAERRVEAMFGPVRLIVTYEEAREHGLVAHITYKMLRIAGGAKTACYSKDVDKKRYPIWKNEQRNLRLARDMITYLQNNPDKQALFSVENIEHGLYVQQSFEALGLRIPLVCGKTDEDRDAMLRFHGALVETSWRIDDPAEVRRYRTNFTHNREKIAIATSIFGTGADFRYLRYLVYGSGLSAKIAQRQWAGRAMRLGDETAEEAKSIVVDALDQFCPSAQRRAAARKGLAKKLGWEVVVA